MSFRIAGVFDFAAFHLVNLFGFNLSDPFQRLSPSLTPFALEYSAGASIAILFEVKFPHGLVFGLLSAASNELYEGWVRHLLRAGPGIIRG